MRLVPAPAAAPGPTLAPVEVDAALAATFGRRCTVTPSGRVALARILSYLRLQPRDEVWITTTTGAAGHAVTPCVTATIARFCRFAESAGPHTGAVLAIHDWGVPHPRLDELRDYCRGHGLPLIEDAAHAFAGTDAQGRPLGTTGDFALFSLPKFFPMARGGLLAGLPAGAPASEAALAIEEVQQSLAGWLPYTDAIAAARRQTYHALDVSMNDLGLGSALDVPPGTVPSLYLLRTPCPFTTLAHLRASGIESGPDDYRGWVFLPCHQQVGAAGIARIAGAVKEALGEAHPIRDHSTGEDGASVPAFAIRKLGRRLPPRTDPSSHRSTAAPQSESADCS